MTERLIVEQCAPTLAGLKTGTMFRVPCQSRETALDQMRSLNNRLKSRGVRVIPLRFTKNSVLVYLYRPNKLRADLSDSEALGLLADLGYQDSEPEQYLPQLFKRIRQHSDFPHEVGLFLGYPPGDVRSFMEHCGQCHKCVGRWKVYGDEDSALKAFDKFRKCTEVYCEAMDRGIPLERLAIRAA